MQYNTIQKMSGGNVRIPLSACAKTCIIFVPHYLAAGLTQIVYWSEEYLIRVDCIGMSDPVTHCHPERTGLQVLSRSGYMDEDTMSHLIRVTRERTQSCVATSGLEAVPFAESV